MAGPKAIGDVSVLTHTALLSSLFGAPRAAAVEYSSTIWCVRVEGQAAPCTCLFLFGGDRNQAEATRVQPGERVGAKTTAAIPWAPSMLPAWTWVSAFLARCHGIDVRYGWRYV